MRRLLAALLALAAALCSVPVVADEPGLSALGAFLVGRTSFPPGVPAQLSAIHDRAPVWYQRPDDPGRGLLHVA